MNVVQQLPQPQNLNIMDLLIFPDSMRPYVCNLSDSLSGEAAKVKYLLTLT